MEIAELNNVQVELLPQQRHPVRIHIGESASSDSSGESRNPFRKAHQTNIPLANERHRDESRDFKDGQNDPVICQQESSPVVVITQTASRDADFMNGKEKKPPNRCFPRGSCGNRGCWNDVAMAYEVLKDDRIYRESGAQLFHRLTLFASFVLLIITTIRTALADRRWEDRMSRDWLLSYVWIMHALTSLIISSVMSLHTQGLTEGYNKTVKKYVKMPLSSIGVAINRSEDGKSEEVTSSFQPMQLNNGHKPVQLIRTATEQYRNAEAVSFMTSADGTDDDDSRVFHFNFNWCTFVGVFLFTFATVLSAIQGVLLLLKRILWRLCVRVDLDPPDKDHENQGGNGNQSPITPTEKRTDRRKFTDDNLPAPSTAYDLYKYLHVETKNRLKSAEHTAWQRTTKCLLIFVVIARPCLQAGLAFQSGTAFEYDYMVDVPLFLMQGMCLYVFIYQIVTQFAHDRIRWQVFNCLHEIKQLPDKPSPIPSGVNRHWAEESRLEPQKGKLKYFLSLSQPEFSDNINAWICIRTAIKVTKGRYDYMRVQLVSSILMVVVFAAGFLFLFVSVVMNQTSILQARRHVLLPAFFDVMLMVAVLMIVIKVGSEIDALREIHISFLSQAILRTTLFSNLDPRIPYTPEFSHFQNSLRSCEQYLKNLRINGDTPTILTFQTNRYFFTTMLGYATTAILYVINTLKLY